MAILTIYHGSKEIIEKPYYHGGKPHNDYGFGFYCTESLELAKEWAISSKENNGFANRYSIELDDLKILDLSEDKYSILNWMAILLKFRKFDLTSEISIQAKEYLLKYFYINVDDYDIIIGYRADDSYFSFARDFVNNSISVKKLSQAMELGQLGKQVVIKSKKGFERLHFEGFENVDKTEYFIKRMARDEKARKDYFQKTKAGKTLKNDVYVIDIIRRGFKNGDPIL